MGCVADKQKQNQQQGSVKDSPNKSKPGLSQTVIKGTMKSYMSQVSTNDPQIMRITKQCILIDLVVQGQNKQISVIYTPTKTAQLLRAKIANHFKVQSQDIQLFFGKKIIEDDQPLQFYTKKYSWIKMNVKINANFEEDLRINNQIKNTNNKNSNNNKQVIQKLDQSAIQIDWQG